MGICVGHQLLATEGLEFGVTPGLDWIKGQVKKLEPPIPALTIPHMGWNAIAFARDHALFKGVEDGAHMYYANSFALTPADPADVLSPPPTTAARSRPLWPRAMSRAYSSTPKNPKPRGSPCSPTSWNGAHDPLSRHRPEGRPVRASAARRHGKGHGLQHQPRRPGRALRQATASRGCTWST
jgi:hypothetical protein